jgi:hypothetical protein
LRRCCLDICLSVAAGNAERALRHAYTDLVSTFESFCGKKAKGIEGKKPSFQELFPTRSFFKDKRSVDILNGLDDDEILVLRRAFNKRHACQHTQGVITERYVKKVPEDAALLGAKVTLSLGEFEQAASILRRVVDNLVMMQSLTSAPVIKQSTV